MNPEAIARHLNAAHAANASGRFKEALDHCRPLLKKHPDLIEAWYNQAVAQRGLQQIQQARESLRQASLLGQQSADALNAFGSEWIELSEAREAEHCLNRALALSPNHVPALSNKARLLTTNGQYTEAESHLRRALALAPQIPQLAINLGAVLNKQTRYAAAESALRSALQRAPHAAEAWNNLANALCGQRRFVEAEAACRQALQLAPKLWDAHANLGDILKEVRRYREAADAYAVVAKQAPGIDFILGKLLYARMQCCDWRDYEALRQAIEQGVEKSRRTADPFGYQAIATSPAQLKRCAEQYIQACFPAKTNQRPDKPATEKIRIGYLSGEFHTQATAILMAGLYEQHDKQRFTLIAIDNGRSDNSPLRQRLEAAFDEWLEIAHMDDTQAAQAIRERQIDILVNLNGYFGKGRQGVFSHRPSPIQVNYLGFPGTLGADYIDYLIADPIVIPPAEQDAYVEKIAWLPRCYQANDHQRPRPEATATRTELGLANEAFVFCCFNNSYKITPTQFAQWMRILDRVPGSLLWLLEDNADASHNLRQAAQALGIAPQRIVFAPRTDNLAHLARHHAADLFLDTLPYNAHTTAADALWMGLPLLTCCGTTFPGRVATSLLQTLGVNELITQSPADYEELAVALATDQARLTTLRQKINDQRSTSPLFDTPGFARDIEAAYTAMYSRHQHGLPPAAITPGS